MTTALLSSNECNSRGSERGPLETSNMVGAAFCVNFLRFCGESLGCATEKLSGLYCPPPFFLTLHSSIYSKTPQQALNPKSSVVEYNYQISSKNYCAKWPPLGSKRLGRGPSIRAASPTVPSSQQYFNLDFDDTFLFRPLEISLEHCFRLSKLLQNQTKEAFTIVPDVHALAHTILLLPAVLIPDQSDIPMLPTINTIDLSNIS